MGYADCLEMAGAKIYDYNEFGDYQGRWFAKVEYNGKKGWIVGSYGSCSGCDAFQAEIGEFNHDDPEDELEWHTPAYDINWDNKTGQAIFKYPNCEECMNFLERMVNFGIEYADTIRTDAEVIKSLTEDVEWDMDAKEALRWVMEHAWFQDGKADV